MSHRSVAARTICYALLTLPVLPLHAVEFAANATVVAAESSYSTEISAKAVSASDTTSASGAFQISAAASEAEEAAAELQADPNMPLPAVAVAKTLRPTTIAVLLPADNSPFLSAGKIVSNGIIAASKTSPVPANILMIESPDRVSMDELLEAAVASGADVVVGPLQRERVEQLAAREMLPIPVVALNTVTPTEHEAPRNLLMMSISTEAEAQYVADLAIKTLPPQIQALRPITNPVPESLSGPVTVNSTDTASMPAHVKIAERAPIAILTMDRTWEKRIETAYKHALERAGVPCDVFTLDPKNLTEVPSALIPTLDAATETFFNDRRRAIRAEERGNPKRLQSRLKELEKERRTRIATAEPPYKAIFLALDAQTASLVKNRLPQRSRIWATSSTNPGDPSTSSSAAALAYDLENVAFTDCPLVVRYDAQSFEARFGTAMPYSLAAKRLFALGVDAYEMAQQWAIGRPIIQFYGESGRLEVDRKASPIVKRTPQTIVVKDGRLIEVEARLLEKAGDMPRIEPRSAASSLPVASQERLHAPLYIAPTITVESTEDPIPSPRIKPHSSSTEAPLE